MKTILKMCLAAALLCASSQMVSAQITVTITPVNRAGLEVFFLKDFDITRPGTGPPIFSVEMNNAGAARTGLIMELAILSQRHGPLSSGRTRPFSMAAGEAIRLTNNNMFTNIGRFSLDEYRFEEDLIEDLIRDILSTGRLPTDVYTFEVRINGPGISPGSGQLDIRVSNPRKLDLVFPGGPATSRKAECPVVFTPLPQFRWESDLRTFRVIIAESRPGEDPESALNREPRFERTFIIRNNRTPDVVPDFGEFRQRPEILPTTTFQFPATGHGLRLRPGRVYYWRVIGLTETSSGRVPMESEIYCFRVARLDNADGKGRQVELILRNLLGSDYEKLFGEGGELEGFEPKRLTFEGKEATIPDLMRRLPKLNRAYSGFRLE